MAGLIMPFFLYVIILITVSINTVLLPFLCFASVLSFSLLHCLACLEFKQPIRLSFLFLFS